jgi:predicted GNAT family N-acyltransferase
MSGTSQRSPQVVVRVVADAAARERAFDVRRCVFQDEQGVPADEEFDTDDDRAIHLIAEGDGSVVGTARIVFHPDYAKVGRMAVLKHWRRGGVGRALLERCVDIVAARGVTLIRLHAQVQALPFYEALGFHVVSEEFEEAGIPHRRMERTVIPTA